MSEELKPKKTNWERELLEKLAFAWVKEQRRNRFWRVFFRTLAFVYLFMLTFYRDWETDRKSTRLNSSHRL